MLMTYIEKPIVNDFNPLDINSFEELEDENPNFCEVLALYVSEAKKAGLIKNEEEFIAGAIMSYSLIKKQMELDYKREKNWQS
jgi:hypothetical protein